jgi:hypothetical protein
LIRQPVFVNALIVVQSATNRPDFSRLIEYITQPPPDDNADNAAAASATIESVTAGGSAAIAPVAVSLPRDGEETDVAGVALELAPPPSATILPAVEAASDVSAAAAAPSEPKNGAHPGTIRVYTRTSGLSLYKAGTKLSKDEVAEYASANDLDLSGLAPGIRSLRVLTHKYQHLSKEDKDAWEAKAESQSAQDRERTFLSTLTRDHVFIKRKHRIRLERPGTSSEDRAKTPEEHADFGNGDKQVRFGHLHLRIALL